jgi:hypothetical protein
MVAAAQSCTNLQVPDRQRRQRCNQGPLNAGTCQMHGQTYAEIGTSVV